MKLDFLSHHLLSLRSKDREQWLNSRPHKNTPTLRLDFKGACWKRMSQSCSVQCRSPENFGFFDEHWEFQRSCLLGSSCIYSRRTAAAELCDKSHLMRACISHFYLWILKVCSSHTLSNQIGRDLISSFKNEEEFPEQQMVQDWETAAHYVSVNCVLSNQTNTNYKWLHIFSNQGFFCC